MPAILGLIRELADYEHALDEVVVTEAELTATLFGPDPAVFAHVAEPEGPGSGVGRLGAVVPELLHLDRRPGLYLEDLYVTPGGRRSGLGRALLAELARLCVERGYARLDWAVLDWNAPALKFYAALGAEPLDTWRLHRLSGPALDPAAERGSRPVRPAQARARPGRRG